MRNSGGSSTVLKFYVAQGASTFVGCVLFAIGLAGMAAVPLYPIDSISFLVQPTGLGPAFDQYYWIASMVVGLWLVLFVFARLAALAGIILIVGKWAILKGILPV